MNVYDPLGDAAFSAGQFGAAGSLGDNTANWDSAFSPGNIHGVLMVISNTTDNINTELSAIESILNGCISPVLRLDASARPGAYQGHERTCFPMYGFRILLILNSLFFNRLRIHGWYRPT